MSREKKDQVVVVVVAMEGVRTEVMMRTTAMTRLLSSWSLTQQHFF